MKLDDILADGAENPTDDPEEMGKFVDQLIEAEDLEDNERSVLCAGYMAGMAHALGIAAKTGDIGDIVGEMMAKEAGWAAKGLI